MHHHVNLTVLLSLLPSKQNRSTGEEKGSPHNLPLGGASHLSNSTPFSSPSCDLSRPLEQGMTLVSVVGVKTQTHKCTLKRKKKKEKGTSKASSCTEKWEKRGWHQEGFLNTKKIKEEKSKKKKKVSKKRKGFFRGFFSVC